MVILNLGAFWLMCYTVCGLVVNLLLVVAGFVWVLLVGLLFLFRCLWFCVLSFVVGIWCVVLVCLAVWCLGVSWCVTWSWGFGVCVAFRGVVGCCRWWFGWVWFLLVVMVIWLFVVWVVLVYFCSIFAVGFTFCFSWCGCVGVWCLFSCLASVALVCVVLYLVNDLAGSGTCCFCELSLAFGLRCGWVLHLACSCAVVHL